MDILLTSIAYDEEGNIFLNRLKLDGEVVQSIKLDKHAILTTLIPSMADQPDFADKMLAELQRRNLARPDHSL